MNAQNELNLSLALSACLIANVSRQDNRSKKPELALTSPGCDSLFFAGFVVGIPDDRPFIPGRLLFNFDLSGLDFVEQAAKV